MEYALELHDSVLVGITKVGDQQIVIMCGYVHRKEETDTGAKYTGWIQAMAFRFVKATVEGEEPPEYPADIYRGEWTIGGVENHDMTLLPLNTTESTSLHIVGGWGGGELTIRGDRVETTLLGEPEYVEESPGAWH